jgi:hypothetical protein
MPTGAQGHRCLLSLRHPQNNGPEDPSLPSFCAGTKITDRCGPMEIWVATPPHWASIPVWLRLRVNSGASGQVVEARWGLPVWSRSRACEPNVLAWFRLGCAVFSFFSSSQYYVPFGLPFQRQKVPACREFCFTEPEFHNVYAACSYPEQTFTAVTCLGSMAWYPVRGKLGAKIRR